MSALTAILNSVLPAAVIALAAWLIGRMLPRTNAATRHLLWWAVLALVIVLPVGIRTTQRAPRPSTMIVAPSESVAEVYVGPVAPPPAPRRTVLPLQIKNGKWIAVLLAVWWGFALVQIVRMVWSFGHLRRLKRRAVPAPAPLQSVFRDWVARCGIRRPVRLLVSDQIAGPLATGFLHPAVILPSALLAQLHDRELDHILLHELAHLARRDDWSNLAALALGALVGLHPVASWVLRQVVRERELSCDDWVVTMTGEARPYAASLARLFEVCGRRPRVALAAGMAGAGSHLGERIELLLGRGRQFTAKVSGIRVMVVAVALLMVLAAGVHMPRWVVMAQSRPQFQPVYYSTGRIPSRESFLAALVAAGYGDLPVGDIISLKDHGVTAEFLEGINKSGWGKLAVAEMISLRAQGVSPEYLARTAAAGFETVTINDVLAMHQHGVRPEDIAQIHALGFGPYSPQDTIVLASRGVSLAFFRALERRGAAHINLTVDQLIKLQQSGVIR